MDKKRAKKIKLVLGILIIVLSLWLSVNAIEDFLNPIRFVSEVTAQPSDYLNRNVQIAGLIVKDSLKKEGEKYRFKLTDGNGTINVEYEGVDPVPDVKPGVGITVVGVLTSEDTIKASKILIKCPSKYKEELSKR